MITRILGDIAILLLMIIIVIVGTFVYLYIFFDYRRKMGRFPTKQDISMVIQDMNWRKANR